jgi:predicted SprT family Zn-dependent metalloprotease
MDVEELRKLAAREMNRYGLYDWTFAMSNTKRRLGVCKYRTKRIEISEYYALNNSAASVLDTLRHEIAHAIAGPHARHGPSWKAVAVKLGANPRACDDSHEVVTKPGDWQATCPVCRKTFHLYRRPRSLAGYQCRCQARSTLTFAFAGDPARAPVFPQTPRDSARWQAVCLACGAVHLRVRRPKAGIWRCRCPKRCVINWRMRA